MKQRILIASFLAVLALPWMAGAATPSPRHVQAAEELFRTMEMESLMDKALDGMIKAQVEANPNLAKTAGVLREFLDKYLSWKAVKPQMVQIYTEAFTEPELREINAFYQTPTGKKAVTVMPDLLQQGMALGQRAVQEHMGELEEAIRKKLAEDGSKP